MEVADSDLGGRDYLDIVNEINDFIASLDAPPLDNHTHKLVGNPPSSGRKKTFGNHGDHHDDDELPESWDGLRSRNRSGDSSCSGNESDGGGGSGDFSKTGEDILTTAGVNRLLGRDGGEGLESEDEPPLSIEHDLEETGQFPVPQSDREAVDPFATYDYVGGDGGDFLSGGNHHHSAVVDYGDVSSDCSNTSSGGSYSIYSDGSGGSSCEAADSDSGCYGYSQLAASGPEDSLSPSAIGGKFVRIAAISALQQQHPHQRHRSDNSNYSDSRSGSSGHSDHNYLGLGSSAHSLSSTTPTKPTVATVAAQTHLLEEASSTDLEQLYQHPTSIPYNHHHHNHHHHHHHQQQHQGVPFTHQFPNSRHQHYQGQYSAPTSPAVKRKLFNQGVAADIKTGRSLDDSTHNLSSFSSTPSPLGRIAASHTPSQSQSVKPVDNHHSHHRLQQQQQQQHRSPQPSRPLHSGHLHHQTNTSLPTQSRTLVADTASPIAEPPPKAPDLSVLISELLSVAPSPCHASPTSPPASYTDFARSESVDAPTPLSPASPPSPNPAASTTHSSPSSSSFPVYSEISCQSKGKHFKGPPPPLPPPPSSSSSSPSSPSASSHYQTPPSQPSSSPVTKTHQAHNEAATRPAYRDGQSISPRHAWPPPASANDGRRSSFSPEHDYEPIDNIQLDIPTSPRPETKFPHPRGQKKMADVGGAQPKHVKALHNFKGSNNDELCFKKGDIITVTQCLDGGWWEGTLNGRTGWFPSNYAKEVRADISLKSNKSGDVPVYKRESMQLYHNVVLKNVIETEKTHVSEMIKVLQSYLKPIEGANLLSGPEYQLLVGNLEEVIAFQQTFLSALEACEKLTSSERRIGGVFMQFAPDMKDMYSRYCANHPRSVSVLQNKREDLSKFVESVGAPTPGAQTLTTILSKPFTRLDKYPSLLKELERHVEESHPDRGDTQRAIAVYKNIANTCSEIRKMKEMEHEIITSTIQGWEGEDISKLGEVLHLSQVKLHTQTGEKFERIFLLFQSCLVMLSMSSRLSSYQYEGNVPLSGLSSATLAEGGDCFEINGPMIEKITVSCGSKHEASTWMELLNNLVSNSGQPASSAKPQPLQVHMISTCQPSVSTVTSAKTAQISSTTAPPPGPGPCPTSVPPPTASNTAPAPPSSQNPLAAKTSCVWSLTCLRPSPPLRPSLMCRDEVLKSPRAVRKSTQKRKPDDPKVYNEDAFILQVIEAYCNSVKTRHTVNSSILNSPQILLAEEEKIFDESEQQERTVVDTVYALQDRVKDLEQEQRKLRSDLDEERQCRRKLETLVRGQVIKAGLIDVSGGGGRETNAT